MPLVSYAVENYRSFVEETSIELRPLTLLFGYNSAGKSSLVRLLPLLADSVSMAPGAGGPLNLTAEAVRGGTFQDLRSRWSDAPPIIRFTLTWDAPPVRKARFTVRDLPERRRQIVEDITLWDELSDTAQPCFEAQWLPQPSLSSELSNIYGVRVDGHAIDGGVSIEFQGLVPEIVPAADYPDRMADIIGKLRRHLQRLPGSIHWLGPWREQPPRSAEYKNRLRRLKPNGWGASDLLAYDRLDNGPLVPEVSAWYERVTQHRLEVESTADGESKRFSIKLSPIAGPPFRIPVVDTGEGMAQVLPVLVLGAMARHDQLSRGSVVAIEHPELHLHPAAHEHLAAFLCSAALASGEPRLLVETHSENFLLRVQREIVEGRFPAERVLVYWVAQETNGRAVARRITFNELGAPQGPWPPGVFSEDIEQARQLVLARRKRHKA